MTQWLDKTEDPGINPHSRHIDRWEHVLESHGSDGMWTTRYALFAVFNNKIITQYYKVSTVHPGFK